MTQAIKIISLGHIVSDRPGFHNERYIFPAGFKSSSIFASYTNPLQKTSYTCEIIDTGEENPLYKVTIDENPEIKFEGNAPSGSCHLLIKQLNELHKKNFITQRTTSISDPEFFDLASPVISFLIKIKNKMIIFLTSVYFLTSHFIK